MEMIYFTAGSREAVLAIGRVLVEERLAACLNVLGEITSVYRWRGAIEEGREVAAIAKTSRENVAKVIDRVKELHDYDCPCIIAWPITQGNPGFLQWVAEQTQPS